MVSWRGMNREVLVVGAGPVGLTAALMLARHNVPVRIIDKNTSATTLSNALIIWKRTLQTLDSVIPWEKFDEGFIRATFMEFIHHGECAMRIDVRAAEQKFPAGILVPQFDTERILSETLQANGITVEREVELISFTELSDCVQCELSIGETLQTPFLIGCDGAHSTVRHTLDAPFVGKTIPRLWNLADIDFDGHTELGATYSESHGDGTILFFPVTEGRLRVFSDAGKDATEKTGTPPSLSDIQHMLDTQSTLGLKATKLHWSGEYIVNERQVESYRHGQIFLAGDAAHVHSPAGGQGMNLGMQDAANLAWKLACVLNGASDSLLDTYQEERHPIGAQVLKFTSGLRKNQTIDNPIIRVFNEVRMKALLKVHAVQHKMAAVICEDEWNYRTSSLTHSGGGDFFPDDSDAYTLLRDKQMTLFCSEQCSFENELLPVSQVKNDAVVEKFGGDVLVRPDGYVAGVGKDEILKWFSRVGFQSA